MANTLGKEACKVWIRSSSRSSPCVFGRSVCEALRNGEDHRTNSSSNSRSSGTERGNKEPRNNTAQKGQEEKHQHRHYDRVLVDFEEKGDGRVVLSLSVGSKEVQKAKAAAKTIPTTTKTACIRRYQRIPYGRSRDCPTLSPRALEDDRSGRRFHPFVRLAVVGMVALPGNHGSNNDTDNDSDNSDGVSLLVTKRPSYMRSFPNAFVFPGGNVDDTDASLCHALSREIREETGLVVPAESWQLECLWESVYPTHLAPLPASAKNNGRETGGEREGILAHHLVCYFSGKPETRPFDSGEEGPSHGEDHRQQQQQQQQHKQQQQRR